MSLANLYVAHHFITSTKNLKLVPIVMQHIVHQYFKQVFEDYQVLVQVNPESLAGMELIIHPDGRVEKTKMRFDEDIFDDLAADGFQSASPLEFNLYLKGLA